MLQHARSTLETVPKHSQAQKGREALISTKHNVTLSFNNVTFVKVNLMITLIKRLQNAVEWRSRHAASNVHNFYVLLKKRRSKLPPVDSRITYPCYKSFDEYIDVEKLKSLNDSLIEKIEKYLRAGDIGRFVTGAFKLKAFSRTRPGSREIPLSVSKRDSYAIYSLDKVEFWELSKHASEFPDLMALSTHCH